MKELTKILINDHATYFKRLWDAEILIRALKIIPLNVVLSQKISRAGVETDLTAEERLEELMLERKILSARVNAYRDELNKTSEGKKALSDWHNGKGE